MIEHKGAMYVSSHTLSIYKSIVMLSLTILISSCASSAGQARGSASRLEEVTLTVINQALSDREFEKALQDIQLLQGNSAEISVSGRQAGELKKQAAAGLEENYREALEKGHYRNAESLGRSLAALSLVSSSPEMETDAAGGQDLLIRQLEAMDVQSGSPVALLDRFLFKNLGNLDKESLQLLGSMAVSEKNGSLVERIADEYTERSLDSPSGLTEFLNSRRRTPQEQLQAVATVWVNRGMTIRGGVGMPDRVIGSGFFIDKRGYLLTNYHVIASEVDPEYEGYSRLYVKFSDDKDTRIPAKVVGYSETFDIALLKTEREPDALLSFSLDETLKAGERIFAIGSPGGLENTLTAGIVSSTGRKFLQMGDVVQVDVPINQGNSGGPLLNENGDLIGVVFAGIEQFEGINFAIPAKWVLLLLENLYQGGAYPMPYLGFSARETKQGLEVIYVAPGSPAERVGVCSGDILLSIDGTAVDALTDAHVLLVQRLPGELTATRWKRGEDERALLIRTGERDIVPFSLYAEIDRPEKLFPALFGMRVELIGEGFFSDRYQVTEVFPGSIADETGFSPLDPFTLQKWQVLEEPEAVIAQLRVKKRKAGFLESGVQLAAYLETANFL
jgi:S1-C subfamily serine protease